MANSILGLLRAAPWKMGPLRGYRSFSLGNAGYDSDIYYGFQDKEYPDFTFTAGPAFQWLVPLKKQIIFDSYQSLQGAFYLKNEKERAFNFRTNNQVHFLFKKAYGKTAFSYNNTRRRFNPELILYIRQEEIAWDGLFLWQFSRSGAVASQLSTSSFNYRNAEYDGLSLDRELNRREIYADTFLYFQPDPGYRFFFNGQLGFYNFKYPESRIKDSRSYAILGGLEFTPELSPTGATVQGGFSLGYIYLDPRSPSYVAVSEIVGNGSVTINLSHWLSLRGYYARGFSVSIYSAFLYYLDTTYGGGFTFRLSNKVSLGNSITFSQADYPLGTDGQETSPAYKFATLSANIGIKLGKEWNFGLFGNMSQRKILPVERKLNRYFIGFNLSFGSVPGENSLPIPSLL
ncbi:MAG: outer membrane beta-barrel protein [Candidatus Saccharicenans sp.]|uniref:outer membrane beta-barrel protein n=1 Tax=Candidatus Saccharicenans sp. TaxID=2819258 RepID=UPI00404B520F